MGIIQGTGIAGSIPRGEPINPFGTRLYVPSTTTIQSVVDIASSGDTIYIEPGEYDEAVTIPATLDSLTLVGTGGRGATFIAPSAADSVALTVLGRDATIINLGCDGDGTGGGAKITGRRFRAYGCKFEGGADAFIIGPGDTADISAGTDDDGSDSLVEDCEFAFATNGVVLRCSDHGATTQNRFKGCVFHNLTTAAITERVPVGGTASIAFRDLEVSDCTFLNDEDGTAPTDYVALGGDNTNTGAFAGNRFATATADPLLLTIGTGVLWMANATEAGWSTGRPA